MLLLAHAFAVELGAKHIGLGCEASHALNQLGKCFAGQDLIDTRCGDFALNTHNARFALGGQLHVGTAQDGDNVTRLQDQVVRGVFLQDGFAQVEWDEFYAQVFGVKALNNCVVPVNLVHQGVDALRNIFASFFTGFFDVVEPASILIVCKLLFGVFGLF